MALYGPLAFDVLGGARYWHQEADLSLETARILDIGDLELVGTRAIARSGSVAWLDPVIGARLRYAVAPSHELFVRGEWAASGLERLLQTGPRRLRLRFRGLARCHVFRRDRNRALAVDYTQGESRQRCGFDMILHGPILGLSMRF